MLHIYFPSLFTNARNELCIHFQECTQHSLGLCLIKKNIKLQEIVEQNEQLQRKYYITKCSHSMSRKRITKIIANKSQYSIEML